MEQIYKTTAALFGEEQIPIGRVGENNYRSISVDCSAWLDTMPDGVLSMLFKNPNGDAYYVNTTTADGVITWVVTNTDAQYDGVGMLQIRLKDGDTVAKSAIAVVKVCGALSTGTEPQPYTPDWTDIVEDMIQPVDDAITNHIADLNNPHHVSKVQLGLENVDNTSDADKPLSNAAIAALADKADKHNAVLTGTVTLADIVNDEVDITAENISIKATNTATSTVDIGDTNVVLENDMGYKFSVGNGETSLPVGISANGSKIHNVGAPTVFDDAANKKYIDDAILDILPQKTVKAPVVAISDAGITPLIVCKAYINAFQQGSGTPSAGNPRNFSGFSKCQLIKSTINLMDMSKAIRGTTGFTKSGDEYYAAALYYSQLGTYLTSVCCTAQKSGAVRFTLSFKAYRTGNVTTGSGLGFKITYDDTGTASYVMLCSNSTSSYTQFSMTTMSGKKIREISFTYGSGPNNIWHIKDFQIEAASAATDFKAFDGTVYDVSLDETVYGGYYDFLAGELTKTHGYIASYDGETINEPWRSSIDAYTEGGTPSTGAQVVYPLSTPEVTTVGTPASIANKYGDNVYCASTGDTEVTYYRDIGLALEALEGN